MGSKEKSFKHRPALQAALLRGTKTIVTGGVVRPAGAAPAYLLAAYCAGEDLHLTYFWYYDNVPTRNYPDRH